MIPTIEQVREHAAKYPVEHWLPAGLWRFRFSDRPTPAFRRLYIARGDHEYVSGHVNDDDDLAIEIVPCDQAGNPLPLVEKMTDMRRLLETAEAGWHAEMSSAMEMRARAEQAEQECDRLAARVAELGAACDAMLDDRVSVASDHQASRAALADELRTIAAEHDALVHRTRYQDVRKLHEAMGLAVGDEGEPCAALARDRDIALSRSRRVAEEFGDLLAALGLSLEEIDDVLYHAGQEARCAGADRAKTPHIEDVAEALANLTYATERVAVAAGIDTEPVWREMHAANMRKLGGATSDDKRLPPAGWRGPDISGVIQRQIERARDR